MESIGIKIKLVWTRRVGAGKKERGSILAKLGSKEEKRRMSQNK